MQDLVHCRPARVLAEGVAKLRRSDQLRLERRGDAIEQATEAVQVRGLVCPVGVCRVLDAAEHKSPERPHPPGPIHRADPAFDAARRRDEGAQLCPTRLCRRHSLPFAGDGVRDADFFEAGEQCVLHVLAVHQIAVDLHLPGAPGQMQHGVDLVAQAAHLFDGHFLHRFGVGLGCVQAGL